MSRLRVAKGLLAAAIALGSLAVVASAGAAAWQGPAVISDATADAGASPVIALGRSGDAGAVWIDSLAGGRIAMARKRAGGLWSTPVTAASPITSTTLFAGVDGAGNITAAYPSGGTTTTVATWSATSAAPTLTPLPGSLTVTDLAVDAAGDAVLAGIGTAAGLTVGYRTGPTGTFALHTYPYTSIGNNVDVARVAINASGTAIVVFVAGPQLGAVTRTAAGDWPVLFEHLTPPVGLTSSPAPAVGVDSAGNAAVAYAYTASGATTLRSALRAAAGGYLYSGDLTPVTAGSTVGSISLAAGPTGAAAISWLQTIGTTIDVKALAGTTTTGFTGTAESVSDAGASNPTAAIGDDGTVVAAWEQAATGGNIGQARVRTPGAAGTWGDTRTLSAVHANGTFPSLATDGRGDFATLSAPYDGTRHPVTLSFYDASPPTLGTPTEVGGPFGGIPFTLATTVSDEWSTAGTPTWTFGDGGTASGLSVNHTYAAVGTYTAHVTVTDSSGNTTGMDVPVVVQTAVTALTKVKFNARWKRSRVAGTLTVAGTAPVAGTYVVDVAKGKTRRMHVSIKLAPGDFSRGLKLPATLLPGTYRVSLVPGSSLVQPATAAAKLAAPSEGVVDVAFLSATRLGKAAHSLRTPRTVWASFHFTAIPKGRLTLTWYRLVRGKQVRLAAASKGPASRIRGSVALLGLHGTILAVLTRAGKVIAQTTVRVQ
jgi:PKD domain